MVTPLQHRVYSFIEDYLTQHAYSPSLSEIATGIGISPKSISIISRSIHSLVEAGKLRFHKKGYRNIELAKGSRTVLPVITASLHRITESILSQAHLASPSAVVPRLDRGIQPREAGENTTYFDFKSIWDSGDHFLWQMESDGLKEEGILAGDFLILKDASGAVEGSLVLALIDKTRPVLGKLSYFIPERITLVPSNTLLKPKAYLQHRVQIQGIYQGVLRWQY